MWQYKGGRVTDTMFLTKLLLFVAVFCINSVICEQCDFADEECLTASCKKTFKPFVLGELGSEPSDPLQVEVIEGELKGIEYKFTNATLTGMKDCEVELVRINTETQEFDYHIACLHLTSEAEYDVKGHFGPVFLEGNGSCKIDLYDYYLLFHGDYEKTVDDDGTPHIQIKRYDLDLDVKGKVHYDAKNLFNGSEILARAALRYANKNWRYIDKLIRKPGMEAYMAKYMDNVNDYLSIASLEDVFHKADDLERRLQQS